MKTVYSLPLLFLFADVSVADVVDFDSLPVNAQGFYNGDTSEGTPLRDNYAIVGTGTNFGQPQSLQEWTSGVITFNNSFTPAFNAWSGWSWSSVQETTTPGFGNQYASFPGGGSTLAGATDAGGVYAVGTGAGYFNIASGMNLDSLFFTSTTYTALAARDGDDGNASPFVSGPFGSQQGDLDPGGHDFLRVTFTGFDAEDGTGATVGSITRYLADFRADKSDNPDAGVFSGADYVLDQWLQVDFSGLAGARSITFGIEGSDVGPFGLNTPAYVAIDTLSLSSAAAVPEPSSLLLVAVGTVLLGRRRLKLCKFKAGS